MSKNLSAARADSGSELGGEIEVTQEANKNPQTAARLTNMSYFHLAITVIGWSHS